MPGAIGDYLERVLDPQVVAVAMAEAVLDGAAAGRDQAPDLGEHLRCVLGMQPRGPEFRVLEHLPGGEAHDGIDVVADEGALEGTGRLVGVHDARRDRHEIALPLARRLQLDGTLLDALLQLVVGLRQLLLGALALAHVGGEADRADLVAGLVDEHGCRDQHRNVLPSLALSVLSKAEAVPPRLRISRTTSRTRSSLP